MLERPLAKIDELRTSRELGSDSSNGEDQQVNKT